MKIRTLFGVLAVTGVVLLPSTAVAKGATEVTVSGPGLEEPLVFDNGPGAGRPTPNHFASRAGLFNTLWVAPGEQAPKASPPPGDLGPKYVATYEYLVGTNRTTPIRQELYPYAEGGSAVYTPPDQEVIRTETRGGWYRAGPGLTALLVKAGLPTSVPVEADESSSASSAREPWPFILIAGGIAIAVVIGILLRRLALRSRSQLAPG